MKDRDKASNKREYLQKGINLELDIRLLEPFANEKKEFVRWVISNMNKMRREASFPEVFCAKFLYENGYCFIPQAPFLITREDGEKKCYFADFYLPIEQMIIELDGSSHQSDEAKAYDEQRDKDFDSIGILTIRIPYSAIPHGFNSIPKRKVDAKYYKISDLIKPIKKKKEPKKQLPKKSARFDGFNHK